MGIITSRWSQAVAVLLLVLGACARVESARPAMRCSLDPAQWKHLEQPPAEASPSHAIGAWLGAGRAADVRWFESRTMPRMLVACEPNRNPSGRFGCGSVQHVFSADMVEGRTEVPEDFPSVITVC